MVVRLLQWARLPLEGVTKAQDIRLKSQNVRFLVERAHRSPSIQEVSLADSNAMRTGRVLTHLCNHLHPRSTSLLPSQSQIAASPLTPEALGDILIQSCSQRGPRLQSRWRTRELLDF